MPFEDDAKLAGNAWLQQRYKLNAFDLGYRSLIGSSRKTEITANGIVEQTYGPGYAPTENSPMAHWEFGLKYDPVNLAFYKAVLQSMDRDQVTAYIAASPATIHHRPDPEGS